MGDWCCSQLKSVLEGEAIWKVQMIHEFLDMLSLRALQDTQVF